MDFIPMFKYLATLPVIGLLLYVMNPIIDFLREEYPIPSELSVYASTAFFLWSIVSIIVIVALGIAYIMEMQRKGTSGGRY